MILMGLVSQVWISKEVSERPLAWQWLCKKDHRLQNVVLKLTREKDHWLHKCGFLNEMLEGPLASQTEIFKGQMRNLKGSFKRTLGSTSVNFQSTCKKDHSLRSVVFKLTCVKAHLLHKYEQGHRILGSATEHLKMICEKDHWLQKLGYL